MAETATFRVPLFVRKPVREWLKEKVAAGEIRVEVREVRHLLSSDFVLTGDCWAALWPVKCALDSVGTEVR